MGHLLKVDDYSTSLSHSKCAIICIEIDLSKPLKMGIWIRDDTHKVFVVVLYEKIPTFCYTCGTVGPGSNSYNHQRSADSGVVYSLVQ